MMPDLVHQHVRYERAQRLLMLGPIVEDRAPIEPDHVRELPGHERRAALRQADAAEQPEEIERAVEAHLAQSLVVGKLLDPDDDAVARTPPRRDARDRRASAPARRPNRSLPSPPPRLHAEPIGKEDDAEKRQRAADAAAPELGRVGGAAFTMPDRVAPGEVIRDAAGRTRERGRSDRLRVAGGALERVARCLLSFLVSHRAAPWRKA